MHSVGLMSELPNEKLVNLSIYSRRYIKKSYTQVTRCQTRNTI